MQVSAEEGHRLWAPVYDAGPNPLLGLEGRVVRSLVNYSPKQVIDVACGTGRWAFYFARCGASVYGVDSCEEMLIEASKHNTLNGRLALADAEHLPLCEGIADLVICSFAASYFFNLEGVLREIARVGAPNASVVISDMHPAAMEAGWSRSFRVNTFRYEMEFIQHSPEEIHAAAVAAGLQLTTHCDASFGEPEQSVFERAGKQHLFTRLSSIPAVAIDVWRRL
jgi:ubiquinone/menaquinone biosynthesis C-methylase UbiE